MSAPSSQGMHSLSTIIKRLEAVTSRLEDVAHSQSSPAPTSSLRSPISAGHDGLSGHVAAPPITPESSIQQAPSIQSQSPAVKAYREEIIDDVLAEVLNKARAIGGPVEQHTALLAPLCNAQLEYLQMASAHAKPSNIAGLLKPQADAIGAITEAKDKLGRTKEGREWGACLSVVSEGVSAWGWVQVETAPAPYIGEMKNAAQFWADRVTKQFKETNQDAIAWAKSYTALLDGLQRYVKQWHTTGVSWNPKGPAAPTMLTASAGPSSSAPAGPPATSAPPHSGAPTANGPTALLAALNKGGSVTSGLKKVDSSQMTHKNPDLRSSSVVPDKKVPPPLKSKPQSSIQKKTPKVDLEDGNKWIIENQEDNREIVIDQTALHQTVHIFGCRNSVVRIAGKINAVSMVGCRKTSIVLESAVSSLSITSSPSFEVQITGSIPTIQIDTTDSGSVYLSEACMNTVEIITSKTSSINISVPTGEGGDFEERPVPEQMKSRLIKGKLITEIVEHAG